MLSSKVGYLHIIGISYPDPPPGRLNQPYLKEAHILTLIGCG